MAPRAYCDGVAVEKAGTQGTVQESRAPPASPGYGLVGTPAVTPPIWISPERTQASHVQHAAQVDYKIHTYIEPTKTDATKSRGKSSHCCFLGEPLEALQGQEGKEEEQKNTDAERNRSSLPGPLSAPQGEPLSPHGT